MMAVITKSRNLIKWHQKKELADLKFLKIEIKLKTR
jgi:hypothetical protein